MVPDAGEYICPHTDDNGQPCGRIFPSEAALATHMQKFRGGDHGWWSPISRLVASNQCFRCRTIHKSIHVTRNHVHASFARGQCQVDRSHFDYTLQEPKLLHCPLASLGLCDCSEEFTAFFALQEPCAFPHNILTRMHAFAREYTDDDDAF